MKSVFLILLLSLCQLSFGQYCRSAQPISKAEFQKIFALVSSQTTNDAKQDRCNEVIGKHCWTSAQVKSLAMLFTEDAYRITFGKAIYPFTFDQVNFIDVYDAFTSMSNAIRLYEFVRDPNNFEQSEVIVQPTTPVTETKVLDQAKAAVIPQFADLIYPSASKYNGNKGCPGPVMDDASFKTVATNVASQPTDESRFVAIKSASQEDCLSMAQSMKLSSLIQSENMRFNAMTEVLDHIYDQDNFISAKALFNSADLQNQWIETARTTLTPPQPPEAVCVTSAEDLRAAVEAIREKNFPSEKLDVVNLINKNHCFSVEQIKTIGNEFTFDQDKLSMMKTLYGKCTDKPNFFKLSKELSFGYLQDDLNKFLKSR